MKINIIGFYKIKKINKLKKRQNLFTVKIIDYVFNRNCQKEYVCLVMLVDKN